jgi:HEAT repeat protein
MMILTKAVLAALALTFAGGRPTPGTRTPDGDPRPPLAWARQDPADSLYRAARDAMGRGEYGRASELFERVVERYPSSTYASDALYYQAFSLYRSGGSNDLQKARRALRTLKAKNDRYDRRGDVASLDTRICGELARRGDAGCTAEVAERAERVERPEPPERPVRPSEARTPSARRGDCPREDQDDRIEVLNALLQMNADRAVPILKRVLARRDECSVELRRKAVFLVSQKRSPETADILMDLVRHDPDREVREQAVFWLSQVPGERTSELLESILRDSRDPNMQDKALFAISQQRGGRGTQILRDYAMREGAPQNLRAQAIFWLGQRRTEESAEFLRALYPRLESHELKDKVLFSLSQQRGSGNERWLMDRALDTRENIELRKQALFWAGQMGASLDQLGALYARAPDAEIREQLIFVFSQRREPAAVDRLLDIARNDRDPEMRKKAIFWLGQSRDPRAQRFLLDIIDK